MDNIMKETFDNKTWGFFDNIAKETFVKITTDHLFLLLKHGAFQSFQVTDKEFEVVGRLPRM